MRMPELPRSSLLRAALVAAVLILSLGMQFRLAVIPDTAGDSQLYQRWARSVDRDGIVATYFGPSRVPIRYLPVIPYVLGGVSRVERTQAFAFLERWGDPIHVLVKLPGVFCNLLISLALFVFLRRRAGFRASALVMTAYAWNPGIAFDTGYWGQTDAIHTLFVLVSTICLFKKLPELAWGAIALAIFTKPQAWPYAPAILLLTLRDYPWRRVLVSLLSAILVTIAIFVPFVREGQLATLFWKMFGFSTPGWLSVNAHNLWWLLTLGPPAVPVSRELLPGVTYRILGPLLSLAVYAWSLARLWRSQSATETFFYLAYVGVSFFMLGFEMHENYLFSVFPFLAAACIGDRRLALVYVLMSLTFLFNMVLHDPFIMIEYYYGLPFEQWYESSGFFYNSEAFMSPTHRTLTLLNSAANLGAYVYLSWRMFKRPGTSCPATPGQLRGSADAAHRRRGPAGWFR